MVQTNIVSISIGLDDDGWDYPNLFPELRMGKNESPMRYLRIFALYELVKEYVSLSWSFKLVNISQKVKSLNFRRWM